ncbi:hypothetical protein MEQ_02846 [Candida albicans P87]|nr:hypothetical protein MEQ_02846 [Candida albicans P87]KGU31244.1 hypothetical protein MGM_02871 [Candida albicans P75063]KHC42562.1 hypothetical protein W5O_02885 [Candida albicans Ca6]
MTCQTGRKCSLGIEEPIDISSKNVPLNAFLIYTMSSTLPDHNSTNSWNEYHNNLSITNNTQVTTSCADNVKSTSNVPRCATDINSKMTTSEFETLHRCRFSVCDLNNLENYLYQSEREECSRVIEQLETHNGKSISTCCNSNTDINAQCNQMKNHKRRKSIALKFKKPQTLL